MIVFTDIHNGIGDGLTGTLCRFKRFQPHRNAQVLTIVPLLVACSATHSR